MPTHPAARKPACLPAGRPAMRPEGALMLDQLLAALTQYGSPALFVVVAIAAVGVPVPVTLLLIVTGSLAAQGAINIWLAIAIAAVGSVAGDQIGFAVGRWGGKKLVSRFSRMVGDAERIKTLDAKAKSWGSAGVFFSRWLVTPLGPWINLASGAADYSWLRFTLWDFLGESFGAAPLHLAGPCFQRPCPAGRRDVRRPLLGDSRSSGCRISWLEAILREKQPGQTAPSSVSSRNERILAHGLLGLLDRQKHRIARQAPHNGIHHHAQHARNIAA